jgi:hypothetical protein
VRESLASRDQRHCKAWCREPESFYVPQLTAALHQHIVKDSIQNVCLESKPLEEVLRWQGVFRSGDS